MEGVSVARNVSLAGRALSARIERGLAPYGISRGEYRVLFALYSEEGSHRRPSPSDITSTRA